MNKNEYKLNPPKCNYCSNVLPFEKRRQKHCNSSCAAKVTNVLKTGKKNFSIQGLDNIRNGCKNKAYKGLNTCKVSFLKCKICNKLFCNSSRVKKTTCSDDCKTELIFKGRKYQNGHKNYITYFNKWINDTVILESSWEKELAEWLDAKEISWVRPKPIRWNDGLKNGLYFPDFYLTEYGIYLDPKNPYCMVKDEKKMEIISKLINIKYGNIETIKQFLRRKRRH